MPETPAPAEQDHVTPLLAQCIRLHEHHAALIAAGFTPSQAMAYLIGVTRRTGN